MTMRKAGWVLALMLATSSIGLAQRDSSATVCSRRVTRSATRSTTALPSCSGGCTSGSRGRPTRRTPTIGKRRPSITRAGATTRELRRAVALLDTLMGRGARTGGTSQATARTLATRIRGLLAKNGDSDAAAVIASTAASAAATPTASASASPSASAPASARSVGDHRVEGRRAGGECRRCRGTCRRRGRPRGRHRRSCG